MAFTCELSQIGCQTTRGILCNEFENYTFNSLAPGRSECDFKNVIFNLVLLIGIFRSSHDDILWWMPQELTDDQSTLVQVMAWCRQATSHYLSQCWLRSLSPYGVTRPQWVKVAITSPWDELKFDHGCYSVNVHGVGEACVITRTQVLYIKHFIS